MANEAEANKSKQGKQRDSTKPGTIVAGPEAHARESAGKMPAGSSAKEKAPAKKSTSRP
ncbi:hypothetical protein [Ensifer sp.]|uniref:hypothetical protein n=1 Tax=Ensifer sp. TaxID=1872086 RepID=UPI0028A01BAC|nr:hypothetical protein [Ensifer sp.]